MRKITEMNKFYEDHATNNLSQDVEPAYIIVNDA
jgi:hypothetical protein